MLLFLSNSTATGAKSVGCVRESLYEFSRRDRPQQDAAWRYVLKQHSLEDVCNIFSLYVLGQMVPTQSADAERGFSLANDCLGFRRLSTRTQTLDCRLRVKQNLPVNTTKSDLLWIGQPRPTEGSNNDSLSVHQIYIQSLMPDAPDMLLRKLHAAVSIEIDKFWVDELAHEMSVLDEPIMDEVDSTPDLADAEGLTIEELTSLLAGGVRE
jgi:hypothetical protein